MAFLRQRKPLTLRSGKLTRQLTIFALAQKLRPNTAPRFDQNQARLTRGHLRAGLATIQAVSPNSC
jgi:hypothetical protein